MTINEPVDLPGPDHRAGPPRKSNAFWRTILQVGPATALGLLLILPEVLKSVTDAFGEQLPPELYAWLISITATLTLVSAVIAKIMAHPKVQAWLAEHAAFFAAFKK